MAILLVMISLLLPAIQQVRETARRAQCRNNLRQIGLALHCYQDAYSRFPPAARYQIRPGLELMARRTSWPPGAKREPIPEMDSVHAHLLSFLEQGNLQNELQSTAQTRMGDSQFAQVPIFRCPSDVSREAESAGEDARRPLSYAANFGTWFIYDPQTGQGGDGAFVINRPMTPADFLDGMSQTLAFAEVKASTCYLGDSGEPTSPNTPPPLSPAEVISYGGQFLSGGTNAAHTDWLQGRVHQTGFTTVFSPNTIVKFTDDDGSSYNVDFVSWPEGSPSNLFTFAAVTARSSHPHSINALWMDGSVRSVGENIDLSVWRALGTRAGGENTSGK
jgi:prepilin-type processing-associated H-X9-DG protein